MSLLDTENPPPESNSVSHCRYLLAYYTTKVIAYQKPKIACHGNVPLHLWTLHHHHHDEIFRVA